MSFRTLFKLTRVGTKVGLAGGVVYLYYDAGLWKGSEETIANYDKFLQDVEKAYKGSPHDLQKWVEYGTSTVSGGVVQPVQKSTREFREKWLSFVDTSFISESGGDGVVKPTWNKGVSLSLEALKDSPVTLSRWSQTGWDMVGQFVKEQSSGVEAPVKH